ncbi:hypothetical protein [Photobacterium minamisatsumaniensis]|uniref:hypothetical protein n=1 Tax=Photobacterium minamisatsumaniensis TaxID=2910233 RepID=UPI003D118A59
MIYRYLAIASALMLAGCNSSDSTDSDSNNNGELVVSGFFSGVSNDISGQPIRVDAALLSHSDSLVTLWDDRDKQTNYIAHIGSDSQSFSFANGQYQCTLEAQAFNCRSNQGDFILEKQTEEKSDIASLAGQYTAVNNTGDLQIMTLGASGSLTIETGNCEVQAKLLEHANKTLLKISQDEQQCGWPESITYATPVTTSYDLTSIDVQSSDPAFPQVWLKQ